MQQTVPKASGETN